MAEKEEEIYELLDALEGDKDTAEPLVNVNRLLTVARKRFYIPLLTLLVGLGLSMVFLRYSESLYSSSSLLKFELERKGDILGISLMRDKESGLAGEIELIKSNLTLNKLIDKNQRMLSVQYFQKGNINDTEHYPHSTYKFDYANMSPTLYDNRVYLKYLDPETVELNFEANEKYNGKYKLNKAYRLDGLAFTIRSVASYDKSFLDYVYYFIPRSSYYWLGRISANLNVAISNPKAGTLTISLTDPNPIRASELVNSLDSIYINETIEIKNKAFENTITFIEEQLDSTDRMLQISESKIEQFVGENQAFEIRPLMVKYLGAIEELENKKKLLVEQKDNLQLLLGNLGETRIDTGVFSSILSDMDNSLLKQEVVEYNKLLDEFNKVAYKVGEDTYLYKSFIEKLEHAQNTLRSRIRFTTNDLNQELAELEQEKKSLENELIDIPSNETKLVRMQRYYDLNENFFLIMMKKKAEMGITKAGTLPDCRILAKARPEFVPISPDSGSVYSVGGSVGLLLGLAILAVLYVLDNKILDPQELDNIRKSSFLGSVPLFKFDIDLAQIMVTEYPRSQFAESLRLVRNNLDFIVQRKNNKVVSVTSTISGEGKTFVSLNLAGIISMSAKKIILVDLDLRRPKLNLAFETENLKGVSTILTEKHTLDECIQSYSANLDYITSGPIPPNPSELLIGQRFSAFLDELKSRYEYVVLDCPPIGMVTDGLNPIRNSDVALYIFRSHYSQRSFIQSLKTLTETKGNAKLGIVLNGVKKSSSYGYGYSFGYLKGNNDNNGYYMDNYETGGFLSRLFNR